MPNISVIVPVYNAEQYLKRCVDSILNQTYQDFELILVDDGSRDGSGMICDRIAEQNPGRRIRVIHQKNAGQSAARNRGIETAEGRWVAFIDSDDYVHPRLLEILYQGSMQNHVKISMCGAVFNAGENTSEGMGPVLAAERGRWLTEEINESFFLELYDADWQLRTYQNEVIWGKLIDIEIVRKYPLTEGRIYEDNAIMCRWFEAAGKVAETAEKMYYYVDNPAGTMNAAFSVKKLDKLWSLEQMEKLFQEKGYHLMAERIQKSYCYVALMYEQSCPDPALKRQLRNLRRRKVLKSIISWKGSPKQKYGDFLTYYIAKKGS